MKSIYKLFAIIAVLALALVPVAAVADSSVADVKFAETPTVTTGFNDGGSGTVTVKLTNDTTSDANVRVKAVEYKNESHVYTSSDVTVPKAVDEVPGVAETKLTWTIDSSGDKTVTIIIYSLDASGNEVKELQRNTLTFYVSHSIWKDAATYVIIIVVIIAIVIAIFIYLRSKESKKKKDPAAKTFTQMREEKLAGKNVSANTQKKSASVEKKTYEASSERKSKRKQ